MRKIGKKLAKVQELVDKNTFYSLTEAIELAKKTSYTKFDASIDLAIKLNLDVRKSDQQLRGAVELPHGTGKGIKVLVATDDPKSVTEAKAAGADLIMGKEDLTSMLQKEELNFDVMVAHPILMPILGRFGKVLGPKGLMPNPKMGTVTPNPAPVVKALKKGKANYRTDKNGIIHSTVGRVSFSTANLEENARVLISKIKSLRPSVVKGTYFQTMTISPSMGPGIKVKIDF